MSSVLVTHTSHFLRGPDGQVYAPNTLIAYSFWQRYRAVFERVGVAARVRRVKQVPPQLPRADGEGVTFCDLPDYLGPWQYLTRRREVRARLRAAIADYEVCCLRVPCVNATLAWHELRRAGRPFGLEVVGDPRDSLAAGAIKTVVRPLACATATRALRAQCRTAQAVAYVTREALQQRYPAAPGAFTTHYSSIELPAEALRAEPRTDFAQARRLIFVGTLEVLYKAPDVLVAALARCANPALHLTIVGDGRARSALQARAEELGVAPQITFAGRLPAGETVRAVLDAADLFVLPSRQEGLPRAMIEAMARGLPCIGSTVGGIPELLPEDVLVGPGDPDALARKITELLGAEERLRLHSARNLTTAREYLLDTLAARREEFYRELIARSET